jgi:predicted transcriptional regulator
MKEIREIKGKLWHWGIKQQWLADKLGVSKSLLSLWLSGTYDMPQDKVNEAKDLLKEIPRPE